MPAFVLNDWQVGTLVAMAGIAPPVEGSPLRALRTYPRPIAPGEPDWGHLVETRLLVPAGTGWRVNGVIAGVLRACAQPEEVVNVGVGDEENPGFSVVRRGELVSECSIARSGTTKLSFPITRSALLLSLIGALSGSDSDGLTPSGFRFRGPAEDAFVLGAALRELRADLAPLTVAGLEAAVARYASEPKLAAGFILAGQRDVVARLASSPPDVAAAMQRLVGAGHLRIVGDAVEVSRAAQTALTKWPTAIFGVSHVEIEDGHTVTRVLQAMRVGARTLAFRPLHRAGEPPEFEWAEVTRRELRTLVAAMCLRDEELDAVASGKKKPKQPSVGAVWAATHVVPAKGISAWADPDRSAAPIAQLEGGVELRVLERRDGLAHVEAYNGWQAWVEARSLRRKHT